MPYFCVHSLQSVQYFFHSLGLDLMYIHTLASQSEVDFG